MSEQKKDLKTTEHGDIAAGLDIGRSGVKLVMSKVGSQEEPIELLFPSVAMPAGFIKDEMESKRAESDTVRIDGEDWWFGDTAEIQSIGGAENSGNFVTWSQTTDYKALTHGAIKRIREHYPEGRILIACALPSEASDSDRKQVTDMTSQAAGKDALVVCHAQPEGVFFQHATARNRLWDKDCNVLVVDVGRYSTDLAVISGGRPARNTYRSVPGVTRATDILWERMSNSDKFQGVKRPPIERLEKALHEHQISLNARTYEKMEETHQANEQMAREIKRVVQEMVTKLNGAIDEIILAGGGAALIKPLFTKEYGLPADAISRFLVAKGLHQRASYLNK